MQRTFRNSPSSCQADSRPAASPPGEPSLPSARRAPQGGVSHHHGGLPRRLPLRAGPLRQPHHAPYPGRLHIPACKTNPTVKSVKYTRYTRNRTFCATDYRIRLCCCQQAAEPSKGPGYGCTGTLNNSKIGLNSMHSVLEGRHLAARDSAPGWMSLPSSAPRQDLARALRLGDAGAPRPRLEVGPVLEGPAAPEQARGRVRRLQRRLYEQRAGAAHGVRQHSACSRVCMQGFGSR